MKNIFIFVKKLTPFKKNHELSQKYDTLTIERT